MGRAAGRNMINETDSTNWLSELRQDGRVVLRVGRRGKELIAEFCSVGTLASGSRGDLVRFEPTIDADAEMIEKLRVSIVEGLVRHAQGKLTLHGGAIALGTSAVALIGPSRSGKSLLVSALCADRGARLVADDTVFVEPTAGNLDSVVHVVPSQKSAWLLPEARSALGLGREGAGKRPVELPTTACSRLRLHAIISLVFSEHTQPPCLRRLRGQQAFSTLSSSLIRFIVDDPVAHQREFEQLRILARSCQIFELRRPCDLSKMDISVEIVRDFLASPVALEHPQ
jgi:hypothetical protein